MDFTAKMANDIAAAQTPEPTADPVEDVKEMIESAVSQVRADMQAQLDAAKARADELEKRLQETSEPHPAEPGIDKQLGGNENGNC